MELSAHTQDWLANWLSGGATVGAPSACTQDELRGYRLRAPATLYRAEVTHSEVTSGGSLTYMLHYSDPSSWSYDPDVAAAIAAGRNVPLVMAELHPDCVLVDTTRLPYAFMRGLFPDEAEVIILPGTYNVQLMDSESS